MTSTTGQLMPRSCLVSLPCKTCPWRTTQDATTIPTYNHAKATSLLNTVGPDDGFRPVMACHQSNVRAEFACRGYVAREGWRNLNVRILMIRDVVDSPDAILDACAASGIELEPDYPMVLAKLAATLAARPGK